MYYLYLNNMLEATVIDWKKLHLLDLKFVSQAQSKHFIPVRRLFSSLLFDDWFDGLGLTVWWKSFRLAAWVGNPKEKKKELSKSSINYSQLQVQFWFDWHKERYSLHLQQRPVLFTAKVAYYWRPKMTICHIDFNRFYLSVWGKSPIWKDDLHDLRMICPGLWGESNLV